MGPDEEIDGQGTETEEEETAVAQETGGGEEVSLNPAWNELLERVPSQIHSQVTPILKQWDQNYQKSLQEVHSKYDPYKDFLEQKPEDLSYALQVMKAIEDDPAQVAKALAEYAGIPLAEAKEAVKDSEQGQFSETEEDELLNHPKFKELNTMVTQMAQLLVQQNQEKSAQEEDKALEAELSALEKEHGEFDPEWVLVKAAARPEIPLAEHVKAFKEHEKSILEKARKPGPKVMKSGGSAPDNQTDVSKLSPAERRALIAKSLENAAREAQ